MNSIRLVLFFTSLATALFGVPQNPALANPACDIADTLSIFKEIPKPVRMAETPGRPVLLKVTVKNGHYDLVWELGRGGEGTVFLATEKGADIPVVVKRVSPKKTNLSPENLQKWAKVFNQAMERLEALGHPHAIKIREVFIENSQIYIVKPWTPGLNLDQLKDALGPKSKGFALAEKKLKVRMNQAMDMESDPVYLELKKQYPWITPLDINPENYVYHRGEWHLIDPYRLPSQM